MFRSQTTATESLTDELELTLETLETLKDLTVTGREAEGVKGGRTTKAWNCECGTM